LIASAADLGWGVLMIAAGLLANIDRFMAGL
jgi:hypothetical protein